jgi:hypothetical protein
MRDYEQYMRLQRDASIENPGPGVKGKNPKKGLGVRDLRLSTLRSVKKQTYW